MLACRLAILPQGTDDELALHRMLGGALALLTLASFGILVSRTLAFNGGMWSTIWPDMRLALSATHFGHAWGWRVPALLLAWAAWPWSGRHRGAPWLVALAAAAIALTRSSTGHPADHGDFTVAVWADWLHLLAAGAWVGSLFGMSLAVFPKLLQLQERATRPAAEVFQRLSTLSGAALALLVACGLYNAVRQLGSFTALGTTPYGITLMVKVGIVLVMVAIGAHNRYVKLPQLLRQVGRRPRPGPIARIVHGAIRDDAAARSGTAIVRACARAVLMEALLGLVVIGATAILIHAMAPADMTGGGMSHPMASAATEDWHAAP
jgi:putative copper export protein